MTMCEILEDELPQADVAILMIANWWKCKQMHTASDKIGQIMLGKIKYTTCIYLRSS